MGAAEVVGVWAAKSRVVSFCPPVVRTYYFRFPTLISLFTK